MRLHGVRQIREQRFVGLLANTEGTRRSHVIGLGVDIAFRNEGDDRCAQRIAQLARDRFTQRPDDVIVLAERDPRSIGFDAAGRNDHRGLAGGQCIANIEPCHLLDPHRVGGG